VIFELGKTLIYRYIHQHWYICHIALPVYRNTQHRSILTVVSTTSAPLFQHLRYQRNVCHQGGFLADRPVIFFEICLSSGRICNARNNLCWAFYSGWINVHSGDSNSGFNALQVFYSSSYWWFQLPLFLIPNCNPSCPRLIQPQVQTFMFVVSVVRVGVELIHWCCCLSLPFTE
jgi:hypothetical protein